MDVIEIREQARQFLAGHTLTAEQLATQIGVPYWWLVKFRQGVIKNCSAERLQKVLDFQTREGMGA